MTEKNDTTDTPTPTASGATIPPTRREAQKARRAERIRQKFIDLKAQHPTVAASRIAAMVAKTERRLADGVTTVPGVTKIIKSFGLWKPRKYQYKER